MVTSPSGRNVSSTTSWASVIDPSASWCATKALTATMALILHLGPRASWGTQKPPTARRGPSRLRLLSAEVRDQIGLHLLKLRAPVGPVVGAVGREVEHRIAAARGDVVVPERLVGPDRQAFEELSRDVRTTQFVGRAVAAVDPEPGVVRDQRWDLHHRVIALPCRVGLRGVPTRIRPHCTRTR